MSHKYLSIISAFILGTGLGWYFVPTKIVERVVIKEQVSTKVDKTTTVVKKPDGTTTTVVIDKTHIDAEKSSVAEKRTERLNKDWLVSASVLADPRNLTSRIYEGSIQRRILGEFYVGILGASNGTLGLGISYRF